jgi:hypothetical protein
MRRIELRQREESAPTPVGSSRDKKKVTTPRSPEAALPELAERIAHARGRPVILDADLAAVYGVEIRTLNQAVKRNEARFPEDFAFRLTLEEAKELWSLRSQNVILKRGQHVKYGPLAFTEHGAIMAASILNSPRAVEMSVFVVRAFVHLRDLARSHAEIARHLDRLERRVTSHDADLKQVFAALRQLLEPPAPSSRRIGFSS